VDRKHEVVDDIVIEAPILARVTPFVQAAMRDVEAMMDNPSGTCNGK
jgi:hypothetical protein